MISNLLQKFISVIIVTLGVLTIVFFILHLSPGDPVEVMLGERSSLSDREQLRESLGLNLPIYQQYQNYLIKLFHFNLGESLHRHKPVSDIIVSRIGATFQLAFISMIIAIIIAFPLGIIAAAYAFKLPDKIAMIISLLGISIPNFVLGPVLILFFSLWLKLLPVSGNQENLSWILPSIALGTAMAAILSRLLRSSLIATKNQMFVTTAKAKGLKSYQCWLKHILPNSLLPVITVIALQLGTLLGGAVIVEIIFSWQGIGSLLVEAIEQRDYPVVQGCMLIISLSYIIINMAVDVLYMLIDPRVRG